MSAEELARLFHSNYERLAPSFGYETRKASAVPWEQVPEQNRALMTAVTGEVLNVLGYHDLVGENERYRTALRRIVVWSAPNGRDRGFLELRGFAREALRDGDEDA